MVVYGDFKIAWGRQAIAKAGYAVRLPLHQPVMLKDAMMKPLTRTS